MQRMLVAPCPRRAARSLPSGPWPPGGVFLDLSTAGVHTGYPALALAVAIIGAGTGLVHGAASTTIMTTVPACQAGVGSAINDTIREVGGALDIAVVGNAHVALSHHGSPCPGPDGRRKRLSPGAG